MKVKTIEDVPIGWFWCSHLTPNKSNYIYKHVNAPLSTGYHETVTYYRDSSGMVSTHRYRVLPRYELAGHLATVYPPKLFRLLL